jgi:hypothetical protein
VPCESGATEGDETVGGGASARSGDICKGAGFSGRGSADDIAFPAGSDVGTASLDAGELSRTEARERIDSGTFAH